jgi:multiple antibiotic resistance protein
MDLFLVICGELISVMNPLGTVPIFVGLTKEYTTLERKKVAFGLLSMFLSYY